MAIRRLAPYKSRRKLWSEGFFKTIYVPSGQSFAILAGAVLFLNLLTWGLRRVGFIELIPNRCPDHEFFGAVFFHDFCVWLGTALPKVDGEVFIGVHTGIGAIIFALLIFAAETLRDDDSKDRARVILRESLLYPLTVLEILVFISFLIFEPTLLGVLSVVAVGALAILALSRTISVLLSRNLFLKKRIMLLKERLFESIDRAIEERLMHNELHSRFNDGSILLSYTPWKPYRDSDDYYVIRTQKRGLIQDINLIVLTEFAKRLETEGLKQGLTFRENESQAADAKQTASASELPTESRQKKMKMTKEQARYLLKLPLQRITDDDSSLLCFKKSLVKDPVSLKQLERLADEVFLVGPEDSFSEEVMRELAGVRDQFLAAIWNKKYSTIEDSSEIYTQIAEGFIGYLQERGGKYSFDQAMKERTAIFGGWSESKWLVDDVADLLAAAIESENLEAIRKTAYLPIGIAVRAAKRTDHYLFQEFIRFAGRLYYSSREVKSEKIREYLRDRSGRFLKEVLTYYVSPKLKEIDASVEDLQATKDFIIYVFILLSDLMKGVIDFDDIKMFKEYAKVGWGALSEDRFEDGHHLLEGLEWQLKLGGLDPETQQQLTQKVERQRQLEKIYDEINLRKRQLFFGLAAWVISLGPDKDKYYRTIAHYIPNDPIELTDLFKGTYSFNTEDLWNWGRWELEPNGQVQYIDFLSKLKRLYLLRMLELIRTVPAEQLEKLDLPYNREIATMSEENGQLAILLDTLVIEKDKWSWIANKESFDEVAKLKALFARTARKQEEADALEKRKRNISQGRVEKFIKENVEAYREHVRLRSVIEEYGEIQINLNKPVPPESNRFGLSTVDDKAAFFDDWHINYLGRDDHFGNGMADGEDSEIFAKLTEKCTKSDKELLPLLQSLPWVKHAVVICSRMSSRSLYKLEGFVPQWRKGARKLDIEHLAGTIELETGFIPVFEFHTRNSDTECLILNADKMPVIRQLSPLGKGESPEHVVGQFYFRVQQFSGNEDLLKEMLSKPPKWVQEIGDQAAQRQHLEERVLIHFYQRFVVEFPEGFEGCRSKIEE